MAKPYDPHRSVPASSVAIATRAAVVERAMVSAEPAYTDTELLDKLEEIINRERAILLHVGDANVRGVAGIGLRTGHLNRTLRQALTSALGKPKPKTRTAGGGQ